MQVKLLRVLQEKEYEPLGATQSVKTDARIVAATHSDLAQEVRRKRFRQDLFFRLNVVRLAIPPLRERREDIPILIQHFIERFNALQGRRIQRCSERVMAILMAHSYPGNVRELENAIEHAYVVCVGDTIQLDDLPPHLIQEEQEKGLEDLSKNPLRNAEAETIRSVLEKHKGNRSQTAKELGISRNTLWRKLKRYGIKDL
jgi:transcriptional regulator with PAS, ATPase and Fis domain